MRLEYECKRSLYIQKICQKVFAQDSSYWKNQQYFGMRFFVLKNKLLPAWFTVHGQITWLFLFKNLPDSTFPIACSKPFGMSVWVSILLIVLSQVSKFCLACTNEQLKITKIDITKYLIFCGNVMPDLSNQHAREIIILIFYNQVLFSLKKRQFLLYFHYLPEIKP